MIWLRRRNQAEGTLVHIIRAYTALYLGGTPSQRTGASPPSCQLLDNSLYIARDKESIIHLATLLIIWLFWMSSICLICFDSHESSYSDLWICSVVKNNVYADKLQPLQWCVQSLNIKSMLTNCSLFTNSSILEFAVICGYAQSVN